MRCSHIIKDSGKRCVRFLEDGKEKCYQHREEDSLPPDLVNIVYSYTIDDVPSEITSGLWNRLKKDNKLLSFLRSFNIDKELSYEDFLIFLQFKDAKEFDQFMNTGKGFDFKKILDGLVKIKNTKAITRFIEIYNKNNLTLPGVEADPYKYLLTETPLDEKMIDDFINIPYLRNVYSLYLFKTNITDDQKDRLMSKISESDYKSMGLRYLSSVKEVSSQEVLYFIDRNIPIPLEVGMDLPSDKFLRALHTNPIDFFRKEKKDMKRILERIPKDIRGMEATWLLKDITVEKIGLYPNAFEILIEAGAQVPQEYIDYLNQDILYRFGKKKMQIIAKKFNII